MGGPCSVRVSVYFWLLQGVAPGPLLMISIELLSASSVERSGTCRLFSPLFIPHAIVLLLTTIIRAVKLRSSLTACN